MNDKIPTGCKCLDKALQGGIAPETITMIYGEAESGKTTFAIQCAVNCSKKLSLKTLFIDCDNTFATERLLQIAQGEFDKVAERIILVRPKDFAEQTALVDQLPSYISKGFGLVVIDTFNSLYRVKISETTAKGSFAVNRELNRQMAILSQTAKTMHMPIIVSSQVRAVFDEAYVSVAPVATRVLQFWADVSIALKPTYNQQIISALLGQKNRNAQEVTCYLRLEQTGIRDVE